ncbi:hypothetical protein OG883_45585 [Streptomyces sp. NBC_01142]|uniref:hypothetical protein n=1 Tax=Streptomyces sp. NBC_01142 TaxID=2975865 RepID=UPI002255DA89|nr:hypothetical protein [Streptomyces sp. NBC_01142]MCX4826913.1 hypothetical protein [Streptomyces sp. NBC_01142]
MSTTYHFPDRLQALQLQLHRVRAQYEQLCRSLPWSVEPSSGRTYERQLMGSVTQTITFADSPGYKPEQILLERRLRRRMIRLSAAIVTYAWWSTLAPGERVDARMALKRLAEPQSGAGSPDKAA